MHETNSARYRPIGFLGGDAGGHANRIGELKQSELLIQTKEDIDMPFEAAEYRHRSIANNELALIDVTRHLPHISAAAEVIGETKAWLRNA